MLKFIFYYRFLLELQVFAQDSPPLIKEHVHFLLRSWGAVYGPTVGAHYAPTR
jgi:hypothetical protein